MGIRGPILTPWGPQRGWGTSNFKEFGGKVQFLTGPAGQGNGSQPFQKVMGG